MKERRTSIAGSGADGRKSRLRYARQVLVMLCLLVMLSGMAYYLLRPPASAAQLGNRFLQLSSSQVSDTANYLLGFQLSTAGTLGSIDIQFCASDPFPGDPCTVPPGLDATGAVLATQSGPTGFAISNASTANEIILTRAPGFAAVGPARYEFTNVVNPSTAGTYYVRVQTFATNDASGPASDYGGIAIAYLLNEVSINVTVPPYLLFCTGVTIPGLNCTNATGDFIDFGELSASKASSGSSQMLIATNAGQGYSITVAGPTMTSGVNVINGLTTGDVSRPGTGQFGFNLRANTTPPDGNNPIGPGTGTPTAAYNQPNFYRLNSGDVIASNTGPEDLHEFTASYIVNVPPGQAPGIYVTTLTYIALATF
jgi:hypothetical protein